MKLKARTKLRAVAVVLLILAMMLFGSLIWTLHFYQNFRASPWNRFTSNEEIWLNFLEVYRSMFFGLLPAMGVVSGGQLGRSSSMLEKFQMSLVNLACSGRSQPLGSLCFR
ncbi:MAG TPA: hypothetical protein VFE51_06440 [Verrucomicrobiae bacterium]|nr:hypothetical protein [Verrucomicrobiae bacterium]